MKKTATLFTALIAATLLPCWALAQTAAPKPAAANALTAPLASKNADPLAAWLGKPAPELRGKVQGGNQIYALSQQKERVTLLAFWSFDCGTCVSRMTELRANAAGWVGKPFDLTVVATDASADSLNNYLTVLKQTGAPELKALRFIWRKDPQHADGFGVLPSDSAASIGALRLFLIDKQGVIKKIFKENLTPADWDTVAELVL